MKNAVIAPIFLTKLVSVSIFRTFILINFRNNEIAFRFYSFWLPSSVCNNMIAFFNCEYRLFLYSNSFFFITLFCKIAMVNVKYATKKALVYKNWKLLKHLSNKCNCLSSQEKETLQYLIKFINMYIVQLINQ